MNKAIFKKIHLPFVFCIVMMSFVLNLPMICYGGEIGIDVSPYYVNIDSRGASHTVHVHTNMPFADVALLSVFVIGEPIDFWKRADSRGYLVVIFDLDELKALRDLTIDGENEITLLGTTKDPDDPTFFGTGVIYVIDKQGP